MAALCQDCDGCCRTLEVKEIGKDFGAPCKHLGTTEFGPGCTIYTTRPDACNHYICLWLDSQRRPEIASMPEALRPDVCKVVMGWPWATDRQTMFVYPYPEFPNAWKEKIVREHLQMILSRGGKVVIVLGSQKIAMKGDMAIVGTENEFAELLS